MAQRRQKSTAKPKTRFSRSLLVIMCFCVLSPLILIGLFIAYWHFSQISPGKAQALCTKLYSDAQSAIQSKPGYEIMRSSRHCNPQEDEVGRTDYQAYANFLVKRTGATYDLDMEAALQQLADRFPRSTSTYFITNTTSDDGADICVQGYRYINDDGATISQTGGSDNARSAARPDYRTKPLIGADCAR